MENMNKVTLRPLAISDLRIRYARVTGPNKIRHYSVGFADQILNNKPALEMVKEYIEKEEGPTEFTVIDDYPKPASNEVIVTVPFENMFDKDPEIEQALLKAKVNSTIYEYVNFLSSPNKFQKVLSYVNSKINQFLIKPINDFIAKNFRINDFMADLYASELDFEELEAHLAKKSKFRLFLNSIPELKYLPIYEDKYDRNLTYSHFLSIAFREGLEEKAKELMLEDLRKIHVTGGILGHFVMPTVILHADTVGDGLKRGALFCMLFVDHHKISKHTGVSLSAVLGNKKPLELLGVTNSVLEGGVNRPKELDPQPEIEEVFVNQDRVDSDNETVWKSSQEAMRIQKEYHSEKALKYIEEKRKANESK